MKTSSTIVFAMSLALLAGAHAQPLAADLPTADPVTSPPVQSYGDRDATCVAWTDECRTCQRDGATVACSNIGIACQPASIRCTQRTEDGKQKTDAK